MRQLLLVLSLVLVSCSPPHGGPDAGARDLGIASCGGPGEVCCSGPTPCRPISLADGGTVAQLCAPTGHNVCTQCGMHGQPCCAGSWCYAPAHCEFPGRLICWNRPERM